MNFLFVLLLLASQPALPLGWSRGISAADFDAEFAKNVGAFRRYGRKM